MNENTSWYMMCHLIISDCWPSIATVFKTVVAIDVHLRGTMTPSDKGRKQVIENDCYK